MNATQLVINERARQISLGYNPAHDACHNHGELSRAALARLLVADYGGQKIGICDVDLLVRYVSAWGNGVSLLRQPRQTLLVEAAALVLAEIDRLLPAYDADPADERAHSQVTCAIAVFSRATAYVSRIRDVERRRKLLSLLDDYADQLSKQVAVELAQLPVPDAETLTKEGV